MCVMCSFCGRLSVHNNPVQLGVDHAVGKTKGRSVLVPQFVLDQLAVQCEASSWTIWCSVPAPYICRDRSQRAAGSPGR